MAATFADAVNPQPVEVSWCERYDTEAKSIRVSNAQAHLQSLASLLNGTSPTLDGSFPLVNVYQWVVIMFSCCIISAVSTCRHLARICRVNTKAQYIIE